jgi:hypothetical protein
VIWFLVVIGVLALWAGSVIVAYGLGGRNALRYLQREIEERAKDDSRWRM